MSPLTYILAALVLAAPLSADLGGYLERSAEAEFTGEQLVACATPDGDRSSVFNLAQEDGSVVAWANGEKSPIVEVAPGLNAIVTEEAVEATVVEGNPLTESDLYSVEERGETTFLGRPAVEVSLHRDGTERVRMTLDTATEAVMRTITFDGDGDRYCDRRLLSFDEDLSQVPEVVLDESGTEPLTPIDETPEVLEESVEGFELVDTYPLDEGSLSYYSDGFFSVGVAITPRPIDFGSSEDVVEVEIADGRYRRVYQAGSVTVAWEADDHNMVLIGDLPPDLAEAFLAELPAPDRTNFFDRIWTRLFG